MVPLVKELSKGMFHSHVPRDKYLKHLKYEAHLKNRNGLNLTKKDCRKKEIEDSRKWVQEL